MSGYRDDLEALQQRERALEQDLREAGERLAAQGATLEQQRAALRGNEAEIARLKAELGARGVGAPSADGVKRCARCGKENVPHYRFCLGCGEDLTATPVGPAGTALGQADASGQQPANGRGAALTIVVAALAVVLVIAGAVTFLLLAG